MTDEFNSPALGGERAQEPPPPPPPDPEPAAAAPEAEPDVAEIAAVFGTMFGEAAIQAIFGGFEQRLAQVDEFLDAVESVLEPIFRNPDPTDHQGNP